MITVFIGHFIGLLIVDIIAAGIIYKVSGLITSNKMIQIAASGVLPLLYSIYVLITGDFGKDLCKSAVIINIILVIVSTLLCTLNAKFESDEQKEKQYKTITEDDLKKNNK